MARRVLTSRAIEAVKPAPGTRYVADGLVGGLGIRYGARGRPAFTLVYRSAGVQKRVGLGHAWTERGDPPAGFITLAQARAEAVRIKEEAARGIEATPAKGSPAAAAEAEEISVETALRRYDREHLAKLKTGREIAVTLRKELPMDRQVRGMGRADIRAILDRIMARGSPVMANRARGYAKSFFAWLADRDLVDANPVTMRRPARETARARVLTDAELRAVWRHSTELSLPYTACIRFLLLTGQRRGETVRMEWAEIEADTWRIPSAKTKNGRAHAVPLPPLAIEAMALVPRVEGARFVFSFNGARPIGRDGLTNRFREVVANDVPGVTLHDLRRTFATGLQRLGVAYEVRELCLNHAGGGVAAVYGRHDYLAERRAAMMLWADHVVASVVEPQGA